MKDKKTNRKSARPPEEDLMESMSAVSATEFTGLIPSFGAMDEELTNEIYSQLYGTPVSGLEIPGEDDSQAKMPQI